MKTLIKLNNIWSRVNRNNGLQQLCNSSDNSTGTVVMFAGLVEKIPTNWLLCDGTEYNISDYPKLYEFLGNTYGGTEGSTFMVPDYRETVLVGAGQNYSDSITTHDVYELGQFKDDQLQQITGTRYSSTRFWACNGVFYGGGTGLNDTGELYGTSQGVGFDSARQARSGTTTHGKQKGVNYIIHI